MRTVFSNNELESGITEKGYVVVSKFLPTDKCSLLYDFFEQHPLADDRAFTISNWNDDATLRSATFKQISDTLLPYSDTLLLHYKPVMGVFTIKKPGAQSDMLLHQDWSLVDETQYRSVSVWVALCDMDSTNGNLQVAEGSHVYASTPRGINAPVPFEHIRQHMHEHCLTDLPLKKGDAIIFDHRLIHASPPNYSNNIRVAAVLALIPHEASLIHYYKPLHIETEFELLQLDEAGFYLFDFFDGPNKPPHTKSLGTVPARFVQLKPEDLPR